MKIGDKVRWGSYSMVVVGFYSSAYPKSRMVVLQEVHNEQARLYIPEHLIHRDFLGRYKVRKKKDKAGLR